MEYCKKCGGAEGLCLGARGRCNCSKSVTLAGYAPTSALVKQVKWWNKALHQMNKAIKRKNKHINRLEVENAELRSQLADFNEMHMKALNNTGA